MKYKFNNKGVMEEVDEEIWKWEAYYGDGKVLKQFDDFGFFHQFNEIDQNRLSVFKMVSNLFPQSYTLIFEKGMKLIHFYYRYCFDYKGENEKKMTVYCFGYQKEKEKRIFMIMPNGELVITSNPDSVKLSYE